MKLNYKYRLFLWFGFIFLIFTIGIALFEQSRNRSYKTELLEEKLDSYSDIVNRVITRGGAIDSLLTLFPPNIRLTFINQQGVVLYDNVVTDLALLENHGNRPEIITAKTSGKGSDIRKSASNSKDYLYYAKYYGEHYVRVALPYDIQVKHFLRIDNEFLYFIVVLFLIALYFISYAAGLFSKSIRNLSDFFVAAENNKIDEKQFVFPKDELGEISDQIVKSYRELEDSRKKIAQEREKLLQHIHSSEEGVCFFNAENRVEFYNGLFIQYLNLLTDNATIEPLSVFSNDVFSDINAFLSTETDNSYYETNITKHGKYFSVRVIVFDDKSFEVIIYDNTKQEKTRQLKQEMTGNIAHELRTPVASIRGYLETILEQKLDIEKERHFITKAYNRVLTLSELISDMSLITKMEEASDTFRMEEVNILAVVEKLTDDLNIKLKEQNISVHVNIPPTVVVNANENLIYSVFRNLTDNVINYAGKDVAIFISLYNTDDTFYYFSFSDTGTGIKDEKHLNRLFERFYRINEGRTRDSGGSGLGLSIVKNAITFHKGTIVVKNKTGGGLEFLFKLLRL